MTRKAPARDQRLLQLKAFGLFIRGEHTLYQIAEALGIAHQNPSTAAGRARTRIEQGWRIICHAKVPRWRRWWSGPFPGGAWQVLHGARLETHPAEEPAPKAPPPTPLDRFCSRLEELRQEARDLGFFQAGEALRNMAAALRYQEREKAEANAKDVSKLRKS